MKQIAILLISTGRYKQFVPPLLSGIKENFLVNHWITVHLFTDEFQSNLDSFGDRVIVIQHIIPSYKFPFATLYRFKTFLEQKEQILKSEYCFYLDVDMSVNLPVDETVLGDITVVRHPGFWYNNGWGSHPTDPLSLAYLAPDLCKNYHAGGFNGGKSEKFMTMCERLAYNIDRDEESGHRGIHNDETALNWFTNFAMGVDYPDWKLNELTPAYCNVPSEHQRQMWEINHLPNIITALDKDHNYMRS
jgi:hypothetical protein